MQRSWCVLVVTAFALVLGAVEVRATSAAPGGTGQQAVSALVITTKTGEHRYDVEVADTQERRSRGLMFRRTLPENRGMLFDFERTQPITMWMQNTPLSLDMVFIRADGTVARVEHGATPFSTATISSGEPVRAVLEVVAGTARRIGLASGDRVRHSTFGNLQ